MDNPHPKVYQASSIDPDGDTPPNSHRLQSLPKITLPKIITSVTPTSDQSTTQETAKSNLLSFKRNPSKIKDTPEHREKGYTERVGFDTLSLSSMLHPPSHMLFAPSEMTSFTGITSKQGAYPLPSKKMSEQELLLSQIAPGSIDFVRAITLRGNMPNPFQDNLYQIKHDVIRSIYGANRPKKLKKYKENFAKNKYLCNIIKKEEETIQKYTRPKAEQQKQQNANRISKSLKLKPMFPVGGKEDNESQDWYEWVDSFEKAYIGSPKADKTLSSLNSSNNMSKIAVLKTTTPTIKA